MTTDSINELVKRLREVETRERILGFGGSETLLLFSKEAADALEAMAGEVERLTRSEEGLLKTLGLERREKHAAQTERDRLAASEERMRSALIDEQRLRGRMYSRAEAAEAERDRLKVALQAIEQGDYYGCVSEFALKALGGDA